MNKLSPAPTRTDIVPNSKLTPTWEKWFRDFASILNNISVFVIPSTIIHNLLGGLQGGSTGQYNHLTNSQLSSLHSSVTVADTSTVDITLSGQQISAETIGLTDTITFVE